MKRKTATPQYQELEELITRTRTPEQSKLKAFIEANPGSGMYDTHGAVLQAKEAIEMAFSLGHAERAMTHSQFWCKDYQTIDNLKILRDRELQSARDRLRTVDRFFDGILEYCEEDDYQD